MTLARPEYLKNLSPGLRVVYNIFNREGASQSHSCRPLRLCPDSLNPSIFGLGRAGKLRHCPVPSGNVSGFFVHTAQGKANNQNGQLMLRVHDFQSTLEKQYSFTSSRKHSISATLQFQHCHRLSFLPLGYMRNAEDEIVISMN